MNNRITVLANAKQLQLLANFKFLDLSGNKLKSFDFTRLPSALLSLDLSNNKMRKLKFKQLFALRFRLDPGAVLRISYSDSKDVYNPIVLSVYSSTDP